MKINYMDKIKEAGLLSRTELTQEELRTELVKFQELICNLIFDDAEAHRVDEAIAHLEITARKNGVSCNPVFRKGITALRKINKEIAISMAGKIGEERVARTLEYVSRKHYKFRNVYVTDGEYETELDNVILTEAGIIILEVKNVKTDITISENGRILYEDEECFHDTSICEKMENKRSILRHELETKLNAKGINIPIRIDSFIVFSAPKSVYVRITDLCKKEKYCFRGKLPFIINDYHSDGSYTDEEMYTLNAVMEEMKTHQKRFVVKSDFNQLQEKIANAMTICLGEPERISKKVDIPNKESNPVITVIPTSKALNPCVYNYHMIPSVLAASVASLVGSTTRLIYSRLL